MKKILLALLVVAGLGGGGYYYAYQQAAKDYPIKVLESVLSTLLKDPESYKRLSGAALANEDNSEMFVKVEYTARNSMGGTVRSNALMCLEDSLMRYTKKQLEYSWMRYAQKHRDKLLSDQENLKKPQTKMFAVRQASIQSIMIDGKLIGERTDEDDLPPFMTEYGTGWYPFTAPKYRDNRAIQQYAREDKK